MTLITKVLGSTLFRYLVLSVCLALLAYTALEQRAENKRLLQNQSAILEQIQIIRLANGRFAAESSLLSLKLDEIQKLYPKTLQEIKEMGIPKRQLVQFSQTALESQLKVETTLKDSISENRVPITDSNRYKTFRYRDNYYCIDGVSFGDKQWLNISNRDTLVQVVFRKRKNRWLWIFSPYVYRQRIQCKNPNANIHYSQIIQVKR